MPNQPYWRYCGKCHTLFYDGYADKGKCSAGGSHEAIGFIFEIPYNFHDTYYMQGKWRFCGKCNVMFYNGYEDKGKCSAGGGHEAIGFNFFLPHNTAANVYNQGDWRYCGRCHALFYDGYQDKGNCPAGGGHQAIGFNFVLPHRGPQATYPSPISYPSQPSPPPPPPSSHHIQPIINVSKQNGNIIVTGSNFKPNAPIRIRIVVGFIGNEYSYYANSNQMGRFTHPIDVSGVPQGTDIFVSATDGTRVPTSQDMTGFLWSNTVPMRL